MKFVVNRVHESSAFYNSNIEGSEIKIDCYLNSISHDLYNCEGWVTGQTKKGTFCHGFTIAEVPDTEEGYYLL